MKPLLFYTLLASVTLSLAKGPPNDSFSKAQVIPPKIPAQAKGSLTDALDRFRATAQDGEPDHAGRKGNGSVWYTWTPATDQRVEVTARSENMDILLAVYTGTSIDTLTLVHRYDNFAFPAFSRKRNEPFTLNARVEFNATAATKYYFAVDTENPVFENFILRIQPSRNPINPELELLPAGSNWEYLLATDENEKPVNPKSLDPDFYHTWMFPKRYDGPKFLKGNAPLGYGKINSFQIKSNLLGKRGSEPPEEIRYTSYLRTTFTPIIDVSAIGVEGVIDDGAIIYINGREVLRINIAPEKNPQDWMSLAAHERFPQIGQTESVLQYGVVRGLNLPVGEPVELSISLHNVTFDSTDMGLDLRIFSLLAEEKK